MMTQRASIRTSTLAAAAAFALGASATHAGAQFYEVQITAVVTGYEGTNAAANLGSEFMLGDTLSLSIVYDGATPLGSDVGGNFVNYPDAIVSISGSINDYTFTRAANPTRNNVGLVNGSSPGDIFDALVSFEGANIGNVAPANLFVSLLDLDDTVFPGGFNDIDGPGLPPALIQPFDFSQFDTFQFAGLSFNSAARGGENQQSVSFALTSVSSAVFIPSVDLTGVLTDEQSSYEFIAARGGDPQNFASSDVSVGVEMPGNFTQDFSTLGDTTLDVTWTAPPGHFIEVAVPAGFNFTDISFEFLVGSQGLSGGASFNPTPIVSLQSDSDIPTLENSNAFLTGPGGNFVQVRTDLTNATPGSVFRFNSVKMSSPISAGYNVSFDFPIVQFSIEGNVSYFGGIDGPPPPADPGQWIRLVSTAVPGDANGDGQTTTADVTFVVSNLGAGSPGATGTPGDVNGDGETTTADITLVVSNLGAGTSR